MLKALKKYKAPYLFILPFFNPVFSYSSWFLPYGHSTSVLLTGRELGIRNFPVWAITRK